MFSVSQGNRNKNKNYQMGPNQAYKLLYSKGNQKQNEKTIYRIGENICKPCHSQGLNFQTTTNSSYNSVTRTQTTQSKMGKKLP